MTRPFLTAWWRDLVFLNYASPSDLVEPLVPRGTVLEQWCGQTLISVVGLRFTGTRLRGIPLPGHRDFPEVNLRFYVTRRAEDGSTRRAVVFVRELVPRRAIAAVARWVYNEPYVAVPMSHDSALDPERGGHVRYGWRHRGASYGLTATVDGPGRPAAPGSEAEFVTDHHWGYTRQRGGETLEYHVEHLPWCVWTPGAASLEGPAGRLYGDRFGEVLAASPRSAYVALGSPIAVGSGRIVA